MLLMAFHVTFTAPFTVLFARSFTVFIVGNTIVRRGKVMASIPTATSPPVILFTPLSIQHAPLLSLISLPIRLPEFRISFAGSGKWFRISAQYSRKYQQAKSNEFIHFLACCAKLFAYFSS